MTQEIYTALMMHTENDDTGDLHCSDDVQKMMTQEIYTAMMMYTENDDKGDLHCSDDVHRK
jgi:hypothetical protein